MKTGFVCCTLVVNNLHSVTLPAAVSHGLYSVLSSLGALGVEVTPEASLCLEDLSMLQESLSSIEEDNSTRCVFKIKGYNYT